MKITLTTATGRFRFESVETVVMDDTELVIWNNGKRNAFVPVDCIDLHLEFTDIKLDVKKVRNRIYGKIGETKRQKQKRQMD